MAYFRDFQVSMSVRFNNNIIEADPEEQKESTTSNFNSFQAPTQADQQADIPSMLQQSDGDDDQNFFSMMM